MSRQDLLNALQALHHHPDGSIKKQASVWLEQWQSTAAAWSTSDSLLHDPSSSVEAQYFCAQTLRTKVLTLLLIYRSACKDIASLRLELSVIVKPNIFIVFECSMP